MSTKAGYVGNAAPELSLSHQTTHAITQVNIFSIVVRVIIKSATNNLSFVLL